MQQLSFDHYTFENAQIAFKLKHRFTGDTFNLLYVVICDPCKNENIAKIEERKIKLRNGARVYRQHIWQPQYQKLEYVVTVNFGPFLCSKFFHKIQS